MGGVKGLQRAVVGPACLFVHKTVITVTSNIFVGSTVLRYGGSMQTMREKP